MYRLLLTLLLLSVIAGGQTGVVKFGGGPVPGATVIARQGDQRIVTTADESGRYDFSNLKPGAYTIEVQMFGFQTARRQVQVPGSSQPGEWTLIARPSLEPVVQVGGKTVTQVSTEGTQKMSQGFRNGK